MLRCSDRTPLLPVNPNDFRSRTITTDGARLNISARGLQSAFERTFFDVRVSHPYAASNVTVSKKREGKKKPLSRSGLGNRERII